MQLSNEKELLRHVKNVERFQGKYRVEKIQKHKKKFKSPSSKVIYCMIPFTQHNQNNKITEMENRLEIATG